MKVYKKQDKDGNQYDVDHYLNNLKLNLYDLQSQLSKTIEQVEDVRFKHSTNLIENSLDMCENLEGDLFFLNVYLKDSLDCLKAMAEIKAISDIDNTKPDKRHKLQSIAEEYNMQDRVQTKNTWANYILNNI